jgi:hypothetical protein
MCTKYVRPADTSAVSNRLCTLFVWTENCKKSESLNNQYLGEHSKDIEPLLIGMPYINIRTIEHYLMRIRNGDLYTVTLTMIFHY